jgi:hypothetical protein
MNIQTVASNLRNTIAGKEHMLDSHKRYLRSAGTSGAENIAIDTTVKFLEINIDELKRILKDVEQCIEKATQDSWALNPDRSGGAFTDEEINRSNDWH